MPKGKVNIYDCQKCGGQTVTIDRDEGVTPFMLDCRATRECKGTTQSRFYTVPDPAPSPDWEWFKPSPEEARHYSDEMREHFAKGGLAIRRIWIEPVKKEPAKEGQRILLVGDPQEMLGSQVAKEISKESQKVSAAVREIKRRRPEPINVDRLLEQLTQGNRQERREAHRTLGKLEAAMVKAKARRGL